MVDLSAGTEGGLTPARPGWLARLRGLNRSGFLWPMLGLLPFAFVLIYAITYTALVRDVLDDTRARVSLHEAFLEADIGRVENLPFVLAHDPLLVETLRGGPPEPLNAWLEAVARRSNIEAAYVMNLSGLTLAASNHAEPGTFLGRNYGFRPYFQDALAGGRGTFYGVGVTSNRPGYFVAGPVRGAGDAILGVVAVKLDLGALEATWEAAWREVGEQVFLTNADGVVLLSSDPDLRYRTLDALPAGRVEAIRATRQFGGAPLTALDFARSSADHVQLDGRAHTAAIAPIESLGWTLHYLIPHAPTALNAAAPPVAFAVLALIVALARFMRKSSRVGAALRDEQAGSAELRRLNERLNREVVERREAEARLRATRAELDRTSRLAALGQLASSVTHELGQPIAAMRSYLTAAEISGTPDAATETLPKMRGLTLRMQTILEELRFFARPAARRFETVDLRDVVATALELVRPNIEQHGVRVTAALDAPARLSGNRTRLEQVATNLLRNAVDAVAEGEDRRVLLRLDETVVDGEPMVRLSVADSGSGLGGHALDSLQEPFFSTKPSGEGMGLGLAICMTIVREHGGRLGAADGMEGYGGAVFTVDLPTRLNQDDAPDQADKTA